MTRKILLAIGIAGICACVGVLHVNSARAAVPEGYVPITMVGPTTAHPGDTVTYTIRSSGENDQPVNVSISNSSAGSFDSIPTSVTIAPNAVTTTFQATFSYVASGLVTVTATSANQSSVKTLMIN